jgi:tetratricopeptide (TPR) repeat protein
MFLDKKKSAWWVKTTAWIVALAFIGWMVFSLVPTLNWGGPSPQPIDQTELQFSDQAKNLEGYVRTNPTDTKGWTELGNVYFDWGSYLASHQERTTEAASKFAQAISFYQKSLELDPDNPDVQTDLASALFYTGQVEGALKELEKVIEKNPQHENANFNKALILELSGQTQAAIEAWEKFIERFPNTRNTERAKARLAALKGQGTPAIPTTSQ